jgi:hypothetical protein
MQNTKEINEIDWDREDLGCIFRTPNLIRNRFEAFFCKIPPERLVYRWEILLNHDYWLTVYGRCSEVCHEKRQRY